MKYKFILLAVFTVLNVALFSQIPNIIGSYTSTTNTFIYDTIGTTANQVLFPKDLDFDLNGSLWSINTGSVNSGGSTVKFLLPGQAGQSSLKQSDGNAWHFMSLPTGIAFSSENGNFATSTGVFDANHNSTDFTGPSLWASDSLVYAQPSPGNGSHLDMLHESPYCMGIAHEVDNVFWVFDAYTGDVVRYDFGNDHGPGGANHDDGKVRRFPEIAVNWISSSVASHLVVDKNTNWLYIVDGGNARVLRLDITSGTPGGIPVFAQNEILAEYTNVTGTTWEVVVNTGLVQPSGIDVVDDRLIVSDYSNGDIVIYDISSTTTMPTTEIGRLNTSTGSGIQGIVVGPSGRIWYANTTKHKIVKIEPSTILNGVDELNKGNIISVYPNPSNGFVTIESKELSSSLIVTDISGKEVYRNNLVIGLKNNFNFSYLSNGLYFVNVTSGKSNQVKKLIIKN